MDFDDAYFTLMNGATLHHLQPFLESIGPRLEPQKPPPSREDLLEAGRWMLNDWQSDSRGPRVCASDDEVMAIVEREMYPAMLAEWWELVGTKAFQTQKYRSLVKAWVENMSGQKLA
jgi:hypothetical protein